MYLSSFQSFLIKMSQNYKDFSLEIFQIVQWSSKNGRLAFWKFWIWKRSRNSFILAPKISKLCIGDQEMGWSFNLFWKSNLKSFNFQIGLNVGSFRTLDGVKGWTLDPFVPWTASRANSEFEKGKIFYILLWNCIFRLEITI